MVSILIEGDGQTITSELVLDAAIQEDHLSESRPTEHPVEEGVNITDHIDVRPEQINIQGLVTDTPLIEFSQLPGGPSRSVDAFEYLQNIRTQRLLVTVLTGLKTYENMVLTSLAPTRNARTGKALQFTASFREVRLVESDVTFIPPDPEVDPVADQAQKEQALGRQKANIPTPEIEQKSSSILFKFGESVVN